MNLNFSLMQNANLFHYISNSYRISCHEIFKILFFAWKILVRAFRYSLWAKKLTSPFLPSFPLSFSPSLHQFFFFYFVLHPESSFHWIVDAYSRNEQMKCNELVCLTCPAEFTARFGSSLFSAWRWCFFIDYNCTDLLLSSIISTLAHTSLCYTSGNCAHIHSLIIRADVHL